MRASHEINIQTEPPARAHFTQTVNQWVIFDFYQKYETSKEVEEKTELEDILKTSSSSSSSSSAPNKKKPRQARQSEESAEVRMLKSAKILERMVNLNTYDEIAQDFRFWEDASDEFKDVEGSLLPLWRFSLSEAKDLEVTSLCWNPQYSDLFAVSFGSYDFYCQPRLGYVCLFSLKNPSYPEWLASSPCSVLSVDIHPRHSHMIVTARYDGTVAVYNLHTNLSQPSFLCDANTGKHSEAAWEARWTRDNLDGYLNFHSVSSDGRVTNWSLVKTNLWVSDVLRISFSKTLLHCGEDATEVSLCDGGRCLAFKPDEPNMFLVGTESGSVVLATTEYSSQYLNSYQAHNTPVYSVHWNNFLTDLFITCAFEFTVKIWHKDSSKPVWRFDLGSQVGDVAWAPYSSTIFAAVTWEGKVFVYDLSVNKYNPVCVQVKHQICPHCWPQLCKVIQTQHKHQKQRKNVLCFMDAFMP